MTCVEDPTQEKCQPTELTCDEDPNQEKCKPVEKSCDADPSQEKCNIFRKTCKEDISQEKCSDSVYGDIQYIVLETSESEDVILIMEDLEEITAFFNEFKILEIEFVGKE